MIRKPLDIFIFVVLLVTINGCMTVDVRDSVVFKEEVMAQKLSTWLMFPAVEVEIDPSDKGYFSDKRLIAGIYGLNPKKSVVRFAGNIGKCGNGIRFFGPTLLPIIPIPLDNSCERNGLFVSTKDYLDAVGLKLQLRYNNQIYNPRFVKKQSGVIQVFFDIKSFSEFEKASDKALIVKKYKTNSKNFIIKELPFDWKKSMEMTYFF